MKTFNFKKDRRNLMFDLARIVCVLSALFVFCFPFQSEALDPPGGTAEGDSEAPPKPKGPSWKRVTLAQFGLSLALHPRMTVTANTDEEFAAVGQKTGFTLLVMAVPGTNHLTFENMIWPLQAITDLQMIDYDTFAKRKFPGGVKGQTLIGRAKVRGDVVKIGVLAVPWPEANLTALIYTAYLPDTGNDGTERRIFESVKLVR